MGAALPVPLICPRCRRVEGDRLLTSALAPGPEGTLQCEGCGRLHPLVDGIPIVLRDLDAWLASERVAVLARQLPPAADALLCAGDPILNRDRHLQRTFQSAGGELPALIRELVAAREGPLCDLGCGPGLHEREDALGLELNFAFARAFPGHGVVGDAADPPFLAHAFETVLLLNLLDSCPDPRTVLGQADALLRPGGTLVVSCPYAWDSAVTPSHLHFEGEHLTATLQGDPGPLGLHFDYSLERVEDRVSWRLAQGPRTTQEHACQVVVATKQSEA